MPSPPSNVLRAAEKPSAAACGVAQPSAPRITPLVTATGRGGELLPMAATRAALPQKTAWHERQLLAAAHAALPQESAWHALAPLGSLPRDVTARARSRRDTRRSLLLPAAALPAALVQPPAARSHRDARRSLLPRATTLPAALVQLPAARRSLLPRATALPAALVQLPAALVQLPAARRSLLPRATALPAALVRLPAAHRAPVRRGASRGLLLAAAVLLGGCAEQAHARAAGQHSDMPPTAAAPRAQLLDLETALPQAPKAEYIGVLVPEQAADVVAPQAGMINGLHAALGEVVNAGQLLVSLSMEQAALEHQRAVAERDAAHAALDRARLEQAHALEESERSQSLANEGLATQEQLAQARFKVNESRALAWEAESRLAERAARAEQQLVLRDQTRVTASFRGRVAVRYVSAGARVAAGTPLLRLISDGALVVRFAVPEQDPALQIGSTVELVPVEEPERSFSARVQRIAPEIDSASRMRTLEAVPLHADALQLTAAGLVGAIVRVRQTEGDTT